MFSISNTPVFANTFIFDFDWTLCHYKNDNFIKDFFKEHDEKFVKNRFKSYRKSLIETEKKLNLPIGINGDSLFFKSMFLDKELFPHLAQNHIDDFCKITENHCKNNLTPGIIEIIKDLKSKGHKVFIVGGASFGCNKIYNSIAKECGIEKKDIYSGKDYSAKEIKEGKVNPPFYYVNCETQKEKVNLIRKSDVIKMLKETNQTHGKIIHIGDGENDLEVWKTKQCDVFIGFGVNYIDKKIKKEAPVFVENMDDFRKEIEKVLSD